MIVHRVLLFVTYSAAPARCEPHRLLSFVTYSAAPARRLSFARAEGKVLFCEGDLPIAPIPHHCALPPSLLERGNGGEDYEGKVLFCEGDLPIAPTPHHCALPPYLLERGNGGED